MKRNFFDSTFFAITMVLLVSFLLLNGCAPKAKVPVLRPAEINLRGTDNIAIGKIDGNMGQSTSELLTSQLFNSNYFQVVDRQNVERIMKEHSFNISGAVNEETASQLGELMGASALVFGNSNYNYNVDKERGETQKDSDGNRYRYYTINSKVTATTNLRIVSLQTGKIIAAKTISSTAKDSNWAKNQWPAEPDRASLVYTTVEETVNDFMRCIAPYTEYVEVKFRKSKEPESEAGFNLAQIGEWEDAVTQFKLAVEKDVTDDAAWYNLGLSYQYTHNYDKAIDAFQQSATLNPSKDCFEQISNVRRLKEERKKLEEQGGLEL